MSWWDQFEAWLVWFWNETSNHPGAFQVVAYVMLTLASVTVAWLSWRQSRRNAIGIRPVVAVTGWSQMKSADHREYASFQLMFELWNRRAYPILFAGGSVRFSRIHFSKLVEGYSYDSPWRFAFGENDTLRYMGEGYLKLDKHEHKSFDVSGPYDREKYELHGEVIRISLRTYDPIKNRVVLVRAKWRFREADFMRLTPEQYDVWWRKARRWVRRRVRRD